MIVTGPYSMEKLMNEQQNGLILMHNKIESCKTLNEDNT